MSLLSICQDAANKIGLIRPTSIVGNTDPDAELLLAIAKEEGFLLARRCYWTFLINEHTFTTAAVDAQPDSLPDDLEAIIPESMFNRSQRRMVYGPISAQEWQLYKAGVNTILNPSYRIRGRNILLAPLQGVGETVVFEYASKNWVIGSNSQMNETWSADTDTSYFHEQIVTQGIIWRWKAHKSMEHEVDRLQYERMVADAIMRDGGKTRLDASVTASPNRAPKIGRAAIQDYNTITP